MRQFPRMHETAIIRNLLEQVGPLEHLDETVMRAAWSARTEDTNVAGVTLHIDRTPVRLRCQACGVARPEVLAGGGVLLRSLEVDEPAGAKASE